MYKSNEGPMCFPFVPEVHLYRRLDPFSGAFVLLESHPDESCSHRRQILKVIGNPWSTASCRITAQLARGPSAQFGPEPPNWSGREQCRQEHGEYTYTVTYIQENASQLTVRQKSFLRTTNAPCPARLAPAPHGWECRRAS